MRVLFLTNIPSPYRVEFFNLLANKCDLTVVYERKAATDREKKWYINSTTEYKVHFLNGIKYSNDASASPGIVRFLDRNKYDIIVVSGYSSISQMLAIISLKRRRIPYILNVDGGIIRRELEKKYRLKKWLISGAAAYLSTGKACDEFLIHYGAEPDRLKRYPFTSVSEKDILEKPLDKVKKQEFKRKISCMYETMILSVGQPIHRKGFDILIKAISRLEHDKESVGVYIIGGEPNEECAKLVKEYHLSNIFFVPFVKKEELSNYYKSADLFVLPTREDIWGLVINEAMAYGLPIITTDKCNAGLELVDNTNGSVVKAGDVYGLANSISDIMNRLSSTDGYQTMGDVSLKKIKNYTLETMASNNFRIFNELLTEYPR